MPIMGIQLDNVNVTVQGSIVRRTENGNTILTLNEAQVREINQSTGKLLEFFDQDADNAD